MIHPASNPDPTEPVSAKDRGGTRLKRLVSAFESAQTRRVRTGEHLRRIALGHDPSWAATPRVSDLDALLARIRTGEDPGPAPAIGLAYRRQWAEERELLAAMSECVVQHPVWPWLRRVQGVGPSLAARLLGRLDVERAPTPSSFWAYCGLATVQAELRRCRECGYEVMLPAARPPRRTHRSASDGAPCAGALVPVEGAASRVAQPRPARGESAAYDREAKKVCYLIGTSIERQGGAYARYYHEQRRRLEDAKGAWIPRRQHLTALRMTEKLFLSHLWLVWRERLGLPLTPSYAQTHADAPSPPSPWDMVDD